LYIGGSGGKPKRTVLTGKLVQPAADWHPASELIALVNVLAFPIAECNALFKIH
jgi:hypothetical protein